MAKVDLKIDWATHEAAKYACANWHYSKCVPKSKIVKCGVWEEGKFIGVVLFSSGATCNIGKPYGLNQQQVCELTRIALTKHKTPVSRIVRLCLKLLKQLSPNLKLIVSYADTGQGHSGAIYQAGNWTYQGYFDGESYIKIKGKVYHRRSIAGKYGTSSVKKIHGAEKVIASGKHKYLMPLDAEMKKQIALLAKPYPKRVKQAITSDQGDSGGAAPTDTLQTKGVRDGQKLN